MHSELVGCCRVRHAGLLSCGMWPAATSSGAPVEVRDHGQPADETPPFVSMPPQLTAGASADDSVQPAADSPLRGLIVHDDLAVQRALAVIMDRCGFHVAAVTGFPEESMPVARAFRPDAVVFDLALSGDLGLRIIPEFLATSSACMVVALSPFTALRAQARELGAMGLVHPRDLRHVEDWLLLGVNPEHPCR